MKKTIMLLYISVIGCQGAQAIVVSSVIIGGDEGTHPDPQLK